MHFKDGHNKQPTNREKEEEPDSSDTDPVMAIRRMTSMESFVEFCHRNGINLIEQWFLIDEHGAESDLLAFGKKLAAYKVELGDTIFKLSGVRMRSRIHQDDIMPTPADSGATVSATAPADADLPSYCLTPHGASYDNSVWDNFVSGIVTLGFIEPGEATGLKNLLGATRQTGRYKPLKEPVRFLSSKKMLAFLVSMMYGTLKYHLPCDVRVKNQMIHKGYYICKPLIVTPSGTGPDEQLRTRDAYWLTLQRSVVLPSASRQQGGGSKHGFATSRKGDVPPEQAAPLIALLLPMGCRRVEE